MALPANTREAVFTAARAAEDKLAADIRAFDVHETVGLADAYFVATGETERQVNAIVESVEGALSTEHGLKPVRREGRAQGRWVLLDYGDIVIHVQHGEDREYYALDRLWMDSPAIDLSEALSAPRGGSSAVDPSTAGLASQE